MTMTERMNRELPNEMPDGQPGASAAKADAALRAFAEGFADAAGTNAARSGRETLPGAETGPADASFHAAFGEAVGLGGCAAWPEAPADAEPEVPAVPETVPAAEALSIQDAGPNDDAAEVETSADYRELYALEMQRRKSLEGRFRRERREWERERALLNGADGADGTDRSGFPAAPGPDLGEGRPPFFAHRVPPMEADAMAARPHQLDSSPEADTRPVPPFAAPTAPARPDAPASADPEAAPGGELDRLRDLARQEALNAVRPIYDHVARDRVRRHVSVIGQAHPDWRDLAGSHALEGWIASQPGYLADSYRRVAERGTAEEVIDLLDRFKGEREAEHARDEADRQAATAAARVRRLARDGAAVPARPAGPPPARADKDDYAGAWSEAARSAARPG